MRLPAIALLALFAATSAPGQQTPPATPTLPAGNASAVGDLLVSPTRLVFEGPRRTAEVTLINVGAAAATYRISLIHLRMKSDGSVEEFVEATSDDRIADNLIRYAPRQVTLEPRVAQTVRIQLRKPADLAAGEYRSHLLFRGVPKPEDLNAETSEATSLSIRLLPVYGVSIPLIVRHGETAARAGLSDLQLMPGKEGQAPYYLRAQLNMSGNRSLYGNLRATVGDRTVGYADGVAIYAGVPSRTVLIPVAPEKDMKLNGRRLRLTFIDAEQADAGDDLLAEAFLDVP